jgi:hypothetical protein
MYEAFRNDSDLAEVEFSKYPLQLRDQRRSKKPRGRIFFPFSHQAIFFGSLKLKERGVVRPSLEKALRKEAPSERLSQ